MIDARQYRLHDQIDFSETQQIPLMYVGRIIIPQFWKNRNICMISAKQVNYKCEVNQLNRAKHFKHCIKGLFII